jgi:putative spermidine/putrescine transport system permease protein
MSVADSVAARSAGTASERRRNFSALNPKSLMALPGISFMAVIYALPVILLVASSFFVAEALSLDAYRRLLGDPYYLGIILKTLKLSFITTVACLLIGYPAAFALALAKGRLQTVLFALIFLPLTVSIIVKTFGLSIMMGRNGVLNWALVSLGIVDRPIRIMFTDMSLYISMVNVFIPFMILPLYSSIRMLDFRLTEAATSLGATPFYVFRRVILPLTMPGIIAGASLVFSISVAAYVTPSLLMGDRYMTMSQVMAKAFLFLRDFELGSAMAVVMLVISVAVILFASYLATMTRRGR